MSPRILVRPSGDSGSNDSPIRIPGETVEGKVSAIEGDDVQLEVDGGGKAVIPVSDFPSLPTVGDAVSGLYLIDDRAQGVAVLTKKTPEASLEPKRVQPGMFVSGSVVEAGKPGLRIRCGEVVGFFPASQLPAGVLRDPGKLLRATVVGLVTDVRNGEMTLSLRTVLDRRQKQRTSRRMATFSEGQRVSGTIVRKTDFGFFVDIGGIDGLLHVSRVERHNELRVQHGEEPVTFEAKQPVDVIVSRVDLDRGRVGLDLPDPDDPTQGYEVSTDAAPAANEVTGILKDLSDEGANVWIEDGVTGWLSARRFDGQAPRPGELRRFRIVSRDDSGRLELSLRLVGEDPEDDDL